MGGLKFKQCIRIGNNITDIMKLCCVRSCANTSTAGICKYKFYPLYMLHPSQFNVAYTGDWLCETENGRWEVLDEKQYQEYISKGIYD